MHKLLFYCLLFNAVCLNASNAQTARDYLEKALSFHHTKVDSSLYYFHLVEQFADPNQDKVALEQTYEYLSTIYRFRKEIDLALKYAELYYEAVTTEARQGNALMHIAQTYESINLGISDSLLQLVEHIALRINDSLLLGETYANYASVKGARGELYESIDYAIKAIDYIGDLGKIQLYAKIANTFLLLENFERAEEYILTAIRLSEQNNFSIRDCLVALRYSEILLAMGKYAACEKENARALACLMSKERWSTLAIGLNTKTRLFVHKEQIDSAKQSNNMVLSLFDKISAPTKAIALNIRSQILLLEENYEEALYNSKRALEIAKEANRTVEEKIAYQLTSEAYEKLSQPNQSLAFFKKYKMLEDSIFRSRQIASLNDLESKYNRKVQDNAIALLNVENQLQADRLNQQKVLMTTGGIVFVIISSLLFFLFRSNRKINQQNTIITKALKEKDILLREIHHRVKNNLQLVSSLLELQSNYVENPKALEALSSGKSRVRSMSLIHQDLYNREELTGVSVQEYLSKLCRELLASYEDENKQIGIKMEVDDLVLDVDTLIPLGLIINELLTNAFKYAFPNKQEGTIEIKLFENDQQLMLEISDDGIGMEKSKASSSSFGYKLIDTLVDQLEGEIRQQSHNGTQLYLKFKEYKKAA